MYKVFVFDLITEDVYEATFGSDEYIKGMKFVMEDDEFNPSSVAQCYSVANEDGIFDKAYIVSKTEEDAETLIASFYCDDRIADVVSAWYSKDYDSYVDASKELTNEKLTSIEMFGHRYLYIESSEDNDGTEDDSNT